MRAVAFVSVSLLLFSADAAFAQQELLCQNFTYNPRAGWRAEKEVIVTGQTGNIQMTPDANFQPGVPYMGYQIGTALDEHCNRTRRWRW